MNAIHFVATITAIVLLITFVPASSETTEHNEDLKGSNRRERASPTSNFNHRPSFTIELNGVTNIGDHSMGSDASNLDPTGGQFSQRIASKRKREQVKMSNDAVEHTLASSNHMVANSLRAHAKAVDIDRKTNLNAHLASGLPPNNSNDIQNVVRPDEESIEKSEDMLHETDQSHGKEEENSGAVGSRKNGVNGEGCVWDADCESGRCDGYWWSRECKAKLADGQNCDANSHCISGMCFRQCLALIENGDKCHFNADCKSRRCDGYGQNGIGWRKCKAKLARGKVCGGDGDCASGSCKHPPWSWNKKCR